MPGNFTSPDGDLSSIFVDDYAMIDQYAKTGSLWVWGYNTSNNLGINNSQDKSSPVQTTTAGVNWKLVSAAWYHSIAIKTDGTLWSWGQNNYGQCGDGTVTSLGIPTQCYTDTSWKQAAAGPYVGGGIKTDGTLWLWGRNFYGALGDNTGTNRSSPVQTVAAGNNWKQLALGGGVGGTGAAIKTDGTLWMWGKNHYGQLGINNTTERSSPVQTIAAGTNWKLVSCGYYYTSAVKTNGTLWSWGYNGYGQCGTNDSTPSYSSPVQTIAGGTNWKTVSCGRYHTAAIKTDGTLWTWGRNNQGQLGNNNTTNYSSPVQTIAAGTNWKFVSCGYGHTAAIKTDGTLWLWGENRYYGPLGDNTTTGRSSPVQTVAAGNNWKMVSCGRYHTEGIHFYDAGNLYPSR